MAKKQPENPMPYLKKLEKYQAVHLKNYLVHLIEQRYEASEKKAPKAAFAKELGKNSWDSVATILRIPLLTALYCSNKRQKIFLEITQTLGITLENADDWNALLEKANQHGVEYQVPPIALTEDEKKRFGKYFRREIEKVKHTAHYLNHFPELDQTILNQVLKGDWELTKPKEFGVFKKLADYFGWDVRSDRQFVRLKESVKEAFPPPKAAVGTPDACMNTVAEVVRTKVGNGQSATG